jgi:hypothetical protein
MVCKARFFKNLFFGGGSIMMKQFQKIQWVACVLILILGIIGCESLAPDGRVGPTAPVDVSPDPADMANLWVGRGQDKYEITQDGIGAFTVNVPAGSYLLTYWTDLGEFHIVFKSETPVVIVIGLQPGDNVYDVAVQQGLITVPEDQALVVQGNVFIFTWPAHPEVPYDAVIENLGAIIVLLQGGATPGETEGGKCTIETVALGGEIKPSGPITKPRGSSHSFKFRPGKEGSPPLTDVLIDKTSVIRQVQTLGNGDGHLVIHDICSEGEDRIVLTGIWGG